MENKLQRIPHEGALAGVCAGIAIYLEIDKAWVRILFVVSVLFSSAFGIGLFGPVVYIVLWIVLPVRSPFDANLYKNYPREATFQGEKEPADFQVDYRVSELRKRDNNPDVSQSFRSDFERTSEFRRSLDFEETAFPKYSSAEYQGIKSSKSNDRVVWGVLLLATGLVLLLFQLDLVNWADLGRFWPIILVFTGLALVVTSFSSKTSLYHDEKTPPAAAENQVEDNADNQSGKEINNASEILDNEDKPDQTLDPDKIA